MPTETTTPDRLAEIRARLDDPHANQEDVVYDAYHLIPVEARELIRAVGSGHYDCGEYDGELDEDGEEPQTYDEVYDRTCRAETRLVLYVADLITRLATAEARVRELEADAERLTKLQRLIAPNPEQGHGADVMLYGGPRDVAIGYGAWHTTMGDLRPSQYATATDLRAAIDLIPDESAARASHQGGARE